MIKVIFLKISDPHPHEKKDIWFVPPWHKGAGHGMGVLTSFSVKTVLFAAFAPATQTKEI